MLIALLAGCARQESAPVQEMTLEDCGEIGRWRITCDAHITNCRCVSTQVRP